MEKSHLDNRESGSYIKHMNTHSPAQRCAFPRCGGPVLARGLCMAHYRQKLRGRELKPVRAGDGVKIPGLTVSPRCAQALRARGGVYVEAKAVLERWARRQKKAA